MFKSSSLTEFCKIYQNISSTYKNFLPLCAAENIISDFCKLPLTSSLQEKYLLGSASVYSEKNNFLGSEQLFPLYEVISNQCENLFKSKYAEARTLSGLNALLTLLISLFNIDDKILISSIDCGGHSSLSLFCKRLGILSEDLPYDYENLDFDYDAINRKLQDENIKGIVICLSDIAFVPQIDKLKLPQDCILLYDVTQILGLIAGQVIQNPFDIFAETDQVILLGATHKTLPGPTCGLVMTQNMELAHKFDTKINPDFLRNIQLHQVASLIFTLAEFEIYGQEYSKAIVNNSNSLGKYLSDAGFNVIQKNRIFSHTHQLFIHNNKRLSYEQCSQFGVSLNFRNKPIYNGQGIRIGTQEITRYGFKSEDMKTIANILAELASPFKNEENLLKKIHLLCQQKHLTYTFSEEDFNNMNLFLHNNKF